jgi:hypothetical protein
LGIPVKDGSLREKVRKVRKLLEGI